MVTSRFLLISIIFVLCTEIGANDVISENFSVDCCSVGRSEPNQKLSRRLVLLDKMRRSSSSKQRLSGGSTIVPPMSQKRKEQDEERKVVPTPEKLKLNAFASTKFAQFGEDGIIQKIFEIIGTTSKICLEVGAGEGIECSNIAHLWKNLGWTGILIEGDQQRFDRLKQNTQNYSNCILVRAFIEPDEQLGQTIDSIVTNLGIQEQLDLLSLDIDGNDYHVFESLKIHPRVIIVEFNPTIPYYFDVYQKYTRGSWEMGCSVGSLIRIGKKKGYALVALTTVNAIFVDRLYSCRFSNYETSVEKLFNTNYLKNIIVSYSGRPAIVGKINHLVDAFSDVGYSNNMEGRDCYTIKINRVDLNQEDFRRNFHK